MAQQTNFFGTNNIIYIILVPSSLLILLLCRTYVTYSCSEFLLSGSAVNQINQNLHLAPIQNIELSEGECPFGYETGMLGQWPGSIRGCTSNAGKPTTYCSAYNIQKIHPFDLTLWKGSNICVQRLTDYKFTSTHCQPGFRKCNSNLCVSLAQKCPITQLIKNSPKRSLQVIRKLNEQPLIALEFSYYDQPCLAKDFAPRKSNAYSLLKQRYGCGKYGIDQNTKILDFQLETDFYQDNRMEWILSKLHQYSSTIEGDQVKLVSRKRPFLNQSPICDQLELVDVPIKSIETVIINQNAWVVLIIIFELLLLFVASSFALSMMLKKDRENVFEFFAIFNIVAVSIVVSVSIVWVGVLYFSTISDLQLLVGLKTKFNSAQLSNCFSDPQINQAISDFDRNLDILPEMFYTVTTNIFYISLLRWFLSVLALLFKKSYF